MCVLLVMVSCDYHKAVYQISYFKKRLEFPWRLQLEIRCHSGGETSILPHSPFFRFLISYPTIAVRLQNRILTSLLCLNLKSLFQTYFGICLHVPSAFIRYPIRLLDTFQESFTTRTSEIKILNTP